MKKGTDQQLLWESYRDAVNEETPEGKTLGEAPKEQKYENGKLEYMHSLLWDVAKLLEQGNNPTLLDEDVVKESLSLVEDIRVHFIDMEDEIKAQVRLTIQ